jgi:hypothetical protein
LLDHITSKHSASDIGRQLLKLRDTRAKNVAAAKRAIAATVDDPELLEGALKEAKSRTLQRELTAFLVEPAATAPSDAVPYGDLSAQQERHDLLVMCNIACGFASFRVRTLRVY